MSDRVLPAVRVVPVEGEGGGEPAVDLVQIHLLVWRLGQSLHITKIYDIFESVCSS